MVHGLVLSAFNIMWTLSVTLNGAAVATVLAYCSGAFTVFLARWLLKEPLTGAKLLATAMSLAGCLLVSGGFAFFTARVAQAAGFHADRANQLIEANGRLTGAVGEPILGREAKLAALDAEVAALGIKRAESLAVGDGANDLDMLREAGLGIAFHAKPIVAAEARVRVDHADLRALLFAQGYRIADIRLD